jgi:TatD DNase family protein
METVVDTHAHLTDPRLAEDLREVLERARDADVGWTVTIASHVEDAEEAVGLVDRVEGVFATAGIHPHAAETADEAAYRRIRELATHPKVIAIGETGLDYHYDNAPRDVQRSVFERHLSLAAELDLPVVVHAREADEDVRAIMRNAGWSRGVLHCFSGGATLLDEALELGWYVSFAGMITFPKWDGADLLRAVPLDRLLVETDSPYLAPVPHRGKRNEPAFVRLVADRAAALRGEDGESLIAATTRNAAHFYGLPR